MKCIKCKRVQPCALALHLLLHRQKIFENMFYNFLLRYHRSRNKKGEGGELKIAKRVQALALHLLLHRMVGSASLSDWKKLKKLDYSSRDRKNYLGQLESRSDSQPDRQRYFCTVPDVFTKSNTTTRPACINQRKQILLSKTIVKLLCWLILNVFPSQRSTSARQEKQFG